MFDDATRDGIARSPFVVVTIRGDDDHGARQEAALRRALTRRGIVLIAATFDGAGEWCEDAALKSSVVLQAWAESGGPVLWLDPDAGDRIELVSADLVEAEFAICDRSRIRGATAEPAPAFDGAFIWFGRSDEVGELLRSWDKRCQNRPDVPDTAHLADALAELPAQGAPRTLWLSPRYAGVVAPDALRGVPLSHSRSLFAEPAHPYYIWAPAYRETSAGIWSLHALCHALNLAGYPAFIFPEPRANPEWMTPIVSQEIADAHARQGIDPIVVYPEIVTGNPVSARTVVRFILNRPGFFTGAPMNEAPDDLLFYYSEEFLDGEPGATDFLTVPTVNRSIFRPDPSRSRDKVLVYQHRFPMERIDLSLFPPGAELLSMANPVSLRELAALLQSAKLLYSYEMSGTCDMAMACGCPVIYRPDGGLTKPPDSFLFGDNGAAMYGEEGGLERATRTLSEVYRVIDGMEDTFWEQLAVFVRKTQAAADRYRR